MKKLCRQGPIRTLLPGLLHHRPLPGAHTFSLEMCKHSYWQTVRARVVGDLPVALGLDEMMRQVRSLQLAVTGVYVDGEGTKIGNCPPAPATSEKEPSKATSPTRWTFSPGFNPVTIMFIQGSFTTHGFAEGVTWLVLTNPISVSSPTFSRCQVVNLPGISLTHLRWSGCSSCATAAPPAPGWPTTAGATSARLLV